MNNEAVCKRVSSMLSLYIDNKVTPHERMFIDEHLSGCPACKKKYLYLKSLIKSLKDSYQQIIELSAKKQKQESFSIREHEKFMENLSPYVDNELEAQECYEFRKYLMKSKNAQKELKNTYIMQKEIRNAYTKTKDKASMLITKNVMRNLKVENKGAFESVILEQIFSQKTAKIAILAGFVLFGAYEAQHLDTPIKPKTVQAKQFLQDNFDAQRIKNAAIELFNRQ